jgi:tetratricopeptide (TPR) repeat protein
MTNSEISLSDLPLSNFKAFSVLQRIQLRRFTLLALGFWILGCLASLAEDNPSALNSQVNQPAAQGTYQEAILSAERAVEMAKRAWGPEDPETAEAMIELAVLFQNNADYTKAEPFYQEALRIARQGIGPEHSVTATILNNLGELYRAMGEYAKAEPLYQEALQIQQKVRPEDPRTALSLNNLGVLYSTMGEYSKAESLYQEALRIQQKVLGSEHPDTAQSLSNLAALYRDMGEYAKAEPLLKEALRIYQKALGSEHVATATGLDNLGQLYQAMGEYAKAEPLLQEALRIRLKIRGSEHPDTACSLSGLGVLYKSMGEYAKAEPLLKEALRIYQKALGSEHAATATSLDNLGQLYQAMGEYAKAEPLLQEALRIRQKVLGSEDGATAGSINDLATLYEQAGSYDKAEPLFHEVLRICQKVYGPEHLHMADCLSNLGLLYNSMGEYAKAEALLQEALRIRQKILGPDHPDIAHSLNNLSLAYWTMHQYAKAEPLLQEALRIRQKVLGSEHGATAESLNNLATLYRDMGEYTKAEALYQEALRIWQKVLGLEHPETALGLSNLGLLYNSMGESTKAEPLLEEGLRIWRKVLGPEHPLTAQGLNSLACYEFDLGRMDEAKALARQWSLAKLRIDSKILSFTSEQQRLAYFSISQPYSLLGGLKGSETDLAETILRYKGLVLDSMVEDRLLAKASQASEGQKLLEQLDLDKRQLGQLLLQPAQELSAETNQRIEALEGETEKIESQLAQHVTDLGQARHALGLSLEQVQVTIPEDGALIEYLLYWHYLGKGKCEWRYGAIVLLSKGAPLWIPLGNADEIERVVRRYGSLIRGSPQEDDLSANLQALYETLWAPIGHALPSQTKRIIISPDGQLNFISFATLLTKDRQFLAQRYNIQYVASGRDLLRELKPPVAKSVVLFANPAFDLASTTMLAKADNGSFDLGAKSIRGSEKREIQDLSFEGLTGTQKERDELTKKFAEWGWKSSDFTAKEATKEALLKIHSPYILHLATHGFFAKEDPNAAQTEPGALLNVRQSVTKSKFFENPMHRSGLALAGAQTTIEAWKRDGVPPVENDGIVTAEDVSTLDLQGTWLVTLSACDTGSGEARAGEGVMGLRRGFIQAGAQNLLMTLWPISDEVTVQIMSDFYEAAHKTGNAPEALAEVQRDWLLKLRSEKGLTEAVNLAGPFIMSSQGKPLNDNLK